MSEEIASGDLADSLAEQGGRASGIERPVRLFELGVPLPETLELGDLFLDGHAPEQVLDARLDRLRAVAIERCRGLREQARRHRHAGEDRGARRVPGIHT